MEACSFASPTPESTARLARRLGLAIAGDADGGDADAASRREAVVVLLVGPLGAGKTSFAQGLAAGLGLDPTQVASPTFTLAAEHRAAGVALRFVHVDCYRLADADELEAMGVADWLAPGIVLAVEWGDRFPGSFPADRLTVTLARERRGRERYGRLGARRSAPSRRRPRRRAALACAAGALARRWPGPRGSSRGRAKRMALVVQKFGGTSVGDLDRIRNVAERVAETAAAGNRVVVCVSAMSGETNKLVALADELCAGDPPAREYDVLVSTGEQKTIALLAMALQQRGTEAQSFTGAQMGMRTDSAHARARIQGIDTAALEAVLDRGSVAVIAGFQGVDDGGAITTLGRGGSDTSAVAVACALGADVCEIYTDVDGVYTTDPRICERARKLERVSYEEMLEMASLGAKVLQIRSVKFAMHYGVPIHVRSSFERSEGTWVTREEDVMERLVVSGVTFNRDEAKIHVRGVKDHPGIAAQVLTPVSDAGIVVDVILQNLSSDGSTDLTFTVGKRDYARALELARSGAEAIGAAGGVEGDENIAKVSIVGLGMKDHAGVATRMFSVLAGEGINIQAITTSEIKVSVVIEEKYTELAVRALHAEFVEDGAAEPAAE